MILLPKKIKKEEYDINDNLFFGLQLNDKQKEFKEAIFNKDNQVVITNSVAGGGKTLIAVACAKLLTCTPEYNGAIYIFPTPEEQTLGFKPGTIRDKESVYLGPLYDALIKINEIPQQVISDTLTEKDGTSWITACSGTYLRGVNIENKVVIIDETQNMTIPLIKRIVSRCHDSCKVIILGCTAQTDILPGLSGFKKTIDYLTPYEKVKLCELPNSYRGWLASAIDGLR